MGSFMNFAQHKELKIEAALLQDEQESSQSPEKLKDISTRMSSIGAELDMIQTILIALGAGALIASVSDDDDDDKDDVISVEVTADADINEATTSINSSIPNVNDILERIIKYNNNDDSGMIPGEKDSSNNNKLNA